MFRYYLIDFFNSIVIVKCIIVTTNDNKKWELLVFRKCLIKFDEVFFIQHLFALFSSYIFLLIHTDWIMFGFLDIRI